MRCRIVHAMAGRTRLRMPALQGWLGLDTQLEVYLQDKPGIAAVYTVPVCASVTITYDPTRWTPQTVQQLLASLSLNTLRTYQSTRPVAPLPASLSPTSWSGILVSSAALAVSLAAPPLSLLLLPLLAGSAWPILSRAYTALIRRNQLNVDVLDASALTLLTLQGQLSAAALMVWLVTLAEYIRDTTSSQACQTIQGALEVWQVDGVRGETVQAVEGDGQVDDHTNIQQHAEQWADAMAPLSMVGAGAVGLLTGSLNQGAAILLVDYGRGMLAAAQTAVSATRIQAMQQGILITQDRCVETLARVEAIVFDTTTALTCGQPEIVQVIPYSREFPADRLLRMAAAAVQRLSHPVARAIVQEANARGLAVSASRPADAIPGLAVETVVEDCTICIGHQRFMADKAIAIMQRAQRDMVRLERRLASPLFVAIDGHLRGLLAYVDPVRPEVPEVLHTLRVQGIKQLVCLAEELSGVTKQAADSLGLSQYFVEASPAAGAGVVQQLQAEGLTVAVVGDGHHSSPALVQANVGIVLAAHTALPQEAVHVVMRHRDLRQLPMALTLARAGVHRVQQNRQLLMTSNTLALGLAGVDWLGPLGVLCLGHGATLVALGNALRPLFTSCSSSKIFSAIPGKPSAEGRRQP